MFIYEAFIYLHRVTLVKTQFIVYVKVGNVIHTQLHYRKYLEQLTYPQIGKLLLFNSMNIMLMNKKNTRGKIKDKRAAILDAALSLITKFGFHGTSMKMIAAEAGIAAGTIYVHFSNKDEMITQLYTQIGQEINSTITSELNDKKPFKENFIGIWRQMLILYSKDPRYPQFITQFTNSPYIVEMNESSQILLEPVYLLLEDAKEKKLVKNLPTMALIGLCHGPITALLRLSNYVEIPLSSSYISAYSTACWDSIKIN